MYKVTDLSAPMGMVGLDVSPAILMPYYDEDSSTLFATGKGDSTIYCFEITDEAPFICPLSHHRCTNLTQGLSFLAKNQCDVAAVEFARALRLTNGTVEPLSFTAVQAIHLRQRSAKSGPRAKCGPPRHLIRPANGCA